MERKMGFVINSEPIYSEEQEVYLRKEKAEEDMENFKKAYPDYKFWLANMMINF